MKMKSIKYIFIVLLGIIGCNNICEENKLDKKYKDKVAFYENVTKIEVGKSDTTNESVTEYIIGYNSDSLEVVIGKSIYIEYDSNKRIIKRFWCIPERDPCCKEPFYYFHHYLNDKIDRIVQINSLDNDTTLIKKYFYDQFGRLIKKIVNPKDTTIYFYNSTDTLPFKQKEVNWEREVITTFEYDSLGLKTEETWIDNKNGLSMKTNFFYDFKKRLIMERDSSLNEQKSSNAYILYCYKYIYDERNRLIEELRTGSTFNESDIFMYRKTYEYKSI